MKYYFGVVLLLALQQPANAEARLHYVAYAAGLRVLDVLVHLALSDSDYQVDVALRTVGVFGAIVPGQTSTTAVGGWNGLVVMPRHYESRGRWRGVDLRTGIDYLPDGPHVRTLEPQPEPEPREPVPFEETTQSIDVLSSMIALVRQVSQTGGCDATSRTFDGRRLSQVAARTVGPEVLPESTGSLFQGTALRCDFQGHLLTGARLGQDRAREMRPHRGSAWFAALTPGGPRLPVRVTFETRFFGNATLYLVGND